MLKFLLLGFAYFFSISSSSALARNVYMNGVDISSARNQNLANVNVRIDEYGNLYIEAPHYQVNEENSFTPLSSWMENLRTPLHKNMQALPIEVQPPVAEKVEPPPPAVAVPEVPADQAKNMDVEKDGASLQNKAGSKVGG